ncbi:MAG: endonuclease/exonuclease/phosphatase family protein, partial [Xanthomonadaceae bacterium]|nr:endonuclease/exonuclease/phosphatase family protein [Xanthomonadaceae bacterium]
IGFLTPWLARLMPASGGTLGWAFDLAAHWQILYAVAWLALCAIAAFAQPRWLFCAPLALLPLMSASDALPAAADAAKPTLTIVAANILASNPNPARLIAWLKAAPADVVVLTELTHGHAAAIERELGALYPHRALEPEDSPIGIGVMARRPLADIALKRSVDGIPSLSARIDIDGRTVRVVAAHPMPPMAPHWHEERDRLLIALAEDAGDMPLIVAGDLNATPWSTALSVAAEHGLRRATGLRPTWSSRYVGIPIDHVLGSAHWRRGDSERGPDIGSDHRPVRATLHWADDPPRD